MEIKLIEQSYSKPLEQTNCTLEGVKTVVNMFLMGIHLHNSTLQANPRMLQ